jgi:protocatechuate 3,4-dioxygenase beta subunit
MIDGNDSVGRVLTRREALALLGASGVAAATPSKAGGGAAPLRLPGCVVRPEQTEGPYFIDERLHRVDIREDPTDEVEKPGVPLHLSIYVTQVGAEGCEPLVGALVDVWQCDAVGRYAGVKDIIGDLFDETGKKYLRGYQITGEDGVAEFLTIYPGWYEGRTVHIHFKIRTDPDSDSGTEFTSQLYFDDEVTDRVLTAAPYQGRDGERTRNQDDNPYRNSGGHQLLLEVEEGPDGLVSSFEIGLNVT